VRWGHDFTTLAGVLVAALCAVALFGYAGAIVWASVRQTQASARFGEASLLSKLVTHDATLRRTVKSVLLVAAMVLTFVALARPQFGSGTKIIPATNLDVVIVLDYSKSMYARDIVPSRIARAKAEVARLIHDLPGARFGAVAFAGEPMSFPLSSDGAAIAQFFRQLEPNDMPVGGTATARALEAAREVFEHDPKSKDHVRVMVLVTDGEDLEGDPVSVAEHCQTEGTRIDVVQIGGRAPEVVPDVAADGKVTGVRRDDQGKPLTTELSAEGEAQLARVAQVTGGTIVRAEHGNTGIDQVARALQRMTREELSEKVETVYAEEYAWPLGAAVVLLIVEAFIGEAPRRRRRALIASLAAPGSLLLILLLTSCGWNPSRPFDRNSPVVKEALEDLDAGDAGGAAGKLEEYLSTGACKEGSIGTPDLLKRRPDGTFDLGLSLFRIGEQFGRRFGQEEIEGGVDETTHSHRHEQTECARRIVQAIADDPSVPMELRARAHYLAGNLDFLDADYEGAVRSYDRALILVPGVPDGGDQVGRDAAWNRAIALRRIDDKKDAGQDAAPDANDASPPDASPPDAGDGGGGDSGRDAGGDGGSGGQDASNGGEDAGNDAGQDAAPPTPPDAAAEPPDAGPPPPTSSEDERMLDQLENAPTLQQEEAKRMGRRRVRGMADK
jgi:Ca-activated chloride channel family protein